MKTFLIIVAVFVFLDYGMKQKELRIQQQQATQTECKYTRN